MLGCSREVVSQAGAKGSVLVFDRDAGTRGDRRLVGHLAADEPAENGLLLARLYIDDVSKRPCLCRRLSKEDARTIPFEEQHRKELAAAARLAGSEPRDGDGNRFRLEPVEAGMSIPELRWVLHEPSQPAQQAGRRIVSLREVVGRLEGYELACGLTLHAVSVHRNSATMSTSALRAELTRVRNSPIVLNRGLREAVTARVGEGELSMSAIAIRCGRIKSDRRGNQSGETSWLARRIGLLPEAGQDAPTPWVHTDVLALISRRGLGLSPMETEVG